MDHNRTALCTQCRVQKDRHEAVTCPNCNCPLYCSRSCRETDAIATTALTHAHGNWCRLMEAFMQMEKKLIDFPFTFTKTTTSPEFDRRALTHFLKEHGVLGKGMWRRECYSWWLCPTGDSKMPAVPAPGNLLEEENVFPWVLPSESVALESAPSAPIPAAGLENWAAYYAWRGFSLDSPIAVLQQWPLTVHFILTKFFAADFPEKFDAIRTRGEVHILLVGVEKEADMASAFQELQFLIPDLRFHLLLVGIEISPLADRRVTLKGNVRIELRRGALHNIKDLPDCDLAIGLNAGLPVFSSWPETLRLLRKRDVPVYFSDYCPYSMDLSKRMILMQWLGSLSEPEINPFRGPLRIYSDQNNLAWFSNALLFRLYTF